MPRAGSIPSLSELKQWLVNEGLTPKQASERYAARGDKVTPTAISVARHRHGWPRHNLDHSALIPWVISQEHRNLFDHRMLMSESSRRQGKELSPEWEKALDNWKDRLLTDGYVVHYQPDTEQGWWRVPRRDGVDMDLIREPSPEDEENGLLLRR